MNEEKYPEHAKLLALRCPGKPEDPFASHNHLVGDFLGWLEGEGYVIARWRPMFCTACEKPWTDHRLGDGTITCEACGAKSYHRSDDVLIPANKRVESLLAGFFGIDEDRLEDEKRQMLADMRAANAEVPS